MKYKLNTQEFAFLDMFWNGNLIELGDIFKYLCYSKLNLIWIQEKILYETQEFAVVYIFSKGNLIELGAIFKYLCYCKAEFNLVPISEW